MRTTALALLAATMFGNLAAAQTPPAPDVQPPAAVMPSTPAPQVTPRPSQPQAGGMMCGMTQGAQAGGGCSCCSGMMGKPQQRQGMMGGMQMGEAQPSTPSAAPGDSPMGQMSHGNGGPGGLQHGGMRHGDQTGAQDDHAGHGTSPTGAQGGSPATLAFRDINSRMHRSMDIPLTNDVDVDFVRSMIPHHRGAVEMAKVALQHSKNPEIRKLANQVIKAQEREIAEMEAIVRRKGAPR